MTVVLLCTSSLSFYAASMFAWIPRAFVALARPTRARQLVRSRRDFMTKNDCVLGRSTEMPLLDNPGELLARSFSLDNSCHFDCFDGSRSIAARKMRLNAPTPLEHCARLCEPEHPLRTSRRAGERPNEERQMDVDNSTGELSDGNFEGGSATALSAQQAR